VRAETGVCGGQRGTVGAMAARLDMDAALAAATEDPPLPAPAPSNCTAIAAAHRAALQSAIVAQATKVLHKTADKVLEAQQRHARLQVRAQKHEARVQAAAATEEQLRNEVERIQRQRAAVSADSPESLAQMGARSAENTPQKRKLPDRSARPVDLREDSWCRAKGDRPADLRPPQAERKESLRKIAPTCILAEHGPGDVEWHVEGPDAVGGPVVRAGSVLQLKDREHLALVIAVNPGRHERRRLTALDAAPLELVCLYDQNAVMRMGTVSHVPKAAALATSMRVNEVLQDDTWYGPEPAVGDIVGAVGTIMYCNTWRQPPRKAVDEHCALLRQKHIYVCTGVLHVHKMPEDFGCGRGAASMNAKPAGEEMVLMPIEWAPCDPTGQVDTHPWEERHVKCSPRVPKPLVLEGGLTLPDLTSPEVRTARYRVVAMAAEVHSQLTVTARVQNQSTLATAVQQWLERKARSVRDPQGTDTAASCELPLTSLETVVDVLVRNGLLDGVQGR